MILCHWEVEILPKLDFDGGHLKKIVETHIAPLVIPRNIANKFPGSSWWKWRLMGMHGDQFWPMDFPCQSYTSMNKNIICWNKNGGHFEFRMILTSGHIKTLSTRICNLKNPLLDILIIKIGLLVQNISTYRFFSIVSGGHFANRFPELPWSSMSIQVFVTLGVVP